MKKLLIILLLAITSVAHGQNVDLQQAYALRTFDNKPLASIYSLKDAKAKYPDYFNWMKFKGATDAQSMTVNEVAAAENQAIWSTDGYVAGNINGSWPQDGCQSRVNIDMSGIYQADLQIPLTIGFGTLIGGGTGNYTSKTSENGGPGSSGGTRLTIDHAHWLTTIFPDRNAMQSGSWGDESFNGYSESFRVIGFRLEGGMDSKPHDPSFQSSGVAIWDSGETSYVEYCFASNFNDAGFHNVRGTPSIFIACSAFSNRRYGFWLDGSSLATIALYSPSGDDNGAADGSYGAFIGGGAGYGKPGGGTLTIVSQKLESDNVQGRMKGHQRFLDLTGFWNVTVTGVQVYSATVLPEAISIDWQGYNGQLDVRGMNLINFINFAKITSNGKTVTYKSPGNYTPFSACVTESGFASASRDIGQGGSIQPIPPVPPVVIPPSTKVIANYDFTTGTPASIVATTGDALVQPVGWQQFTGIGKGVLSNSNSNASYPVAWKGVTHITIIGLTWSGTPGYQSLMGNAGGALKVYPDGSIVDSRNFKLVAPKGTVTAGKSVDLDLTIAPMDVSYFGAVPGNGNCWKGSMTGFILQ